MRLRLVVVCGLLACQVGTQVAAWQFQHHPVLGWRLQVAPQPLYPPTGLVVWTWGLWRLQGAACLRDPRLKLAWSASLLVFVGGLAKGASSAASRSRPMDRQATRRDLWRRFPRRHGVVLGRTGWRGRVLYDDSDTHVLVLGPTREAGKGENTVVPTLLGGWRQSVLVYDPKGELSAMTKAYRATFSEVITCNPTSLSTQGCNLLASVVPEAPTEHQMSARLMARLTDPEGTADQHESSTGKHFRELSNLIGQGLLLYGLRIQQTTLPAIAQLLYTTPVGDLAQAMMALPHPLIFNAGTRLGTMDGPQLEGLLSTLQRAFAPFLDPAVARLTSRTDFDLATLRQGARPLTLYYEVPFADQDQLRAVTRLWFHTVFDAALRSLTAWDTRLLVLLDEVTTLRHFPLLIDGFDFGAGYGMKFCIITTSLNRLESIYGPRHNFEEGSAVRLFFAPNTRRMSLRLAQDTGEQWITRTRTSRQLGMAARGQRSVSEDEQPTALLSAQDIAQLGSRYVLLRVGDQLTAKLRKIRAWKERPWRGRRTPLGTQAAPLRRLAPWGFRTTRAAGAVSGAAPARSITTKGDVS